MPWHCLQSASVSLLHQEYAVKPEQIEDNAKALGVSLEESDIVQMKKDIETLL